VTKAEIIATTRDLMKDQPVALVTVDGAGAPQARWMMGALLDDNCDVYMLTHSQSRKIAQIKAQPKAQILVQAPDFSCCAALSGECEIVQEASMRAKAWAALPAAAAHFSGVDGPDCTVIRLCGKRIELLAMTKAPTPFIAEL
jgi:general stress protein 26